MMMVFNSVMQANTYLRHVLKWSARYGERSILGGRLATKLAMT